MLQGNAGGTRGHWWPRGRPTTGLVGFNPPKSRKTGPINWRNRVSRHGRALSAGAADVRSIASILCKPTQMLTVGCRAALPH